MFQSQKMSKLCVQWYELIPFWLQIYGLRNCRTWYYRWACWYLYQNHFAWNFPASFFEHFRNISQNSLFISYVCIEMGIKAEPTSNPRSSSCMEIHEYNISVQANMILWLTDWKLFEFVWSSVSWGELSKSNVLFTGECLPFPMLSIQVVWKIPDRGVQSQPKQRHRKTSFRLLSGLHSSREFHVLTGKLPRRKMK